ncbi:MAG: hypothetical protein WC011_01940 [Candidatus Paceibacterota bacterium]
MIIFFKKFNKGNSLIEVVFYVAIFAVTVVLVMNSTFLMISSFKENFVNHNLKQHAQIIENIAREIKNSEGIVSMSESSIKLSKKDINGADHTIEFLQYGNGLNLYEDDQLSASLTGKRTKVLDFSVTSLGHIRGSANYEANNVVPLASQVIKLELTLQTIYFGFSRTETFYNTIVLRSNY